jgi:hypothetical protein
MRLALRCARDSMPPLRLAILRDVAAHPSTTPTEVRKTVGQTVYDDRSPHAGDAVVARAVARGARGGDGDGGCGRQGRDDDEDDVEVHSGEGDHRIRAGGRHTRNVTYSGRDDIEGHRVHHARGRFDALRTAVHDRSQLPPDAPQQSLPPLTEI